MQYQVIEQDKPGDAWRFCAHGARFSHAEAVEAVARGKSLGVKRKAIGCGNPRKERKA